MSKLTDLVQQQLERLIFYTVFFSTAYFYQGANPNANSRFDLARSLVLQQTLQIDAYAANTVDKAFHDNHYYSDKAPGVAFAAAGVMSLVRPVIENLDLTRRVKDNSYLIFISLSLLAGFTAYTAVRFFRLARFILGGDPSLAVLITLITFLGTFVFPYATILFSHQITGNLIFLVFDFAVRQFLLPQKPSSPFLPLTLAALIPVVELPAAGPALVLSAWIIFKSWKKYSAWLLIPGVVVGILFGLYNYLAFGSPFSIGYGNLGQTPFDAAMQQGFFGIKLPRLSRLPQLLFFGYRGLFYYNPILLFAMAGFAFAWRRYRLAVAAPLGCFFYFLLVNMSYNFWQGGACIGPRHMVPVIPVLAIGFLFLPRSWLKHPVFILVAGLSWLLMLVSTAVYVVPPEEVTNPFWGDILPLFKSGLISVSSFPILAYETFIAQPSSATWSSFNLGELAFRLRGKLSLLPLLILQSSAVGLALFPAMLRSVKNYVTSLASSSGSFEISCDRYLLAFVVALLVYLFRIYPWDLVPGWQSQFRPFFDPIDMDVFMQRGQWAVQGLKPYVDVFAEYPVIPVLLFGGISLLTSNIALFEGLLFAGQAWLAWELIKHLCLWEPRLKRTSLVLLFLPSTIYFSLNRFDLLVSVVLGGVILFLARGWFVRVGTLFGCLVFVKWASVLALPAVTMFVWQRHGRLALLRLLGTFLAAIGAAFLLQYIWFGWEGLLIPLQWQASRNPNEGSLAFLLLWPLKSVGVSVGVRQMIPDVLTLCALLFCLLPLLSRVRSLLHVALSMIFVNSAFILFSKVYSPQWIIWSIVPWAVALALLGKEGRLSARTWICVALENVSTYLFFPIAWDLLGSSSYLFLAFATLHVLVRGFVLWHVGGLFYNIQRLDSSWNKVSHFIV